MLEELKRDVLNGKRSLAEAITLALPSFRNKLSEHKIAYLVSEYQGYANIALDYYKRPSKEYPNYRVVPGQMKMMQIDDGQLADLTHPLASKSEFFIAAPIAWVEESLGLGIDPTMVEMAELGKLPNGIVVIVTAKAGPQRIIDIVRQSLLSFIDEAEMS
jgi:hypothetical protein